MKDIFRPLFRTPEDRAANRKEQLRRAQRNFRERRETYLRNLERQVTSMQKNEVEVQVEIQQLKSRVSKVEARLKECEAENQKLHAFLASHDGRGLGQTTDMFMNAVVDSNEPPEHAPVNTIIWVESNGSQPAHLHLRNTSQDSTSPLKDPSCGPLPSPGPSPEESTFQNIKYESISVGGQLMAQLRHPAHLSDRVGLLDMDLVMVGMEFVLKLENPCLPHILKASEEQHSTHGHVHLATHAVLCCSPGTHTTLPSGTTWQAPKDTLKRLLDYSPELPIEDSEVTPVQAWQQITLHPHFPNLRLENLNALSDRLLKDIKCYGFGAVIRQEYLDKLLSST